MGPLEATTIRRSSRLVVGVGGPTAMLIASALSAALPNPVLAETDAASYSGVIEAALEVCQDVPSSRNELTQMAVDAGWSVDSEAALSSLFSVQLIKDWDANDLETTLFSGVFMAASILGNSRLDPDQPGFSYFEVNYAVLNFERVDDQEPYCVLSGPYEIEAALLSAFDLNHENAPPGQRRASTNQGHKRIQLIVKDPDETDAVVEAFSNEHRAEVEAEWLSRFRPVNLVIAQMPQEDQ